ncbi:MAG: hypothetical protein LKF48_07530 [Prevotella sp.]|jgi:hypothetical protein|nr:hypothetical protein [Prevotella sp.]MCH4182990.1 hypothetical protein [Prevotella sp.]
MKIKLDPEQIFQEYEDGKTYNNTIELDTNVEKNERFFIGDQWAGVNAPNLMKPVFNLVKRVTTYFVAMMVTDDISVHITPFNDSKEMTAQAHIIERELSEVIEKTKLKAKTRTAIKNCCVDGDTDMFVSFNPDLDTGMTYKGDIENQIIDNTNIIFGNPYSSDVQSQPYILIIQKLFTDQVKDYAEECGCKNLDDIVSDNDADFVSNTMANNNGSTDNLTTVITKLWKEKRTVKKKDKFGLEYEEEVKTVKYMKCTRKVVIKKNTDLGYKLYPVAHMTWEPVKQSYHGRSPITGLIPNQIFINKMFAMCMVYMTNMGFPKIFYDTNKLKQYTNDVTKANGIANIDLLGKVIDAAKAPDFSSQVMELIDKTISYTKDFMGASDAALGNINNPDNTSAIVAVQQASAVPLEIQRLAFYDYIEDIVRICIDVMAEDYGTRTVKITPQEAEDIGAMEPVLNQYGQAQIDQNTNQVMMQAKDSIELDNSVLKGSNYKMNVEIGQSTYWSETTQIQTMDNLFTKGIITDAVTYLESIPDKYIPNKSKIIDEIKQKQEQQEQLSNLQNIASSMGVSSNAKALLSVPTNS